MDYERDDGDILAAALRRLNLLDQSAQLPTPYERFSGVAGKSRVYAVYLPFGNAGRNLIAKFDSLERATREWNALESLRRLNVPLEALLPIGGNTRSDGVVLYQSVDGLSTSGQWTNLCDLLRDQLAHNPTQCRKALDLSLGALRPFYTTEPGACRIVRDGVMLSWRTEYVFLPKLRDLMARLATHVWPSVDWNQGEVSLPELTSHDAIPNPILFLEQELLRRPGRVALSRIHGDLNLTNILITQTPTFTPDKVFIIDLANSIEQGITARDLARFESEFWHEVVPSVSKQEGWGTDPFRTLQGMATIRDGLEGRSEFRGVLADSGVPQFLRSHRQQVGRLLSGGEPDYLLHDYFQCLYFAHLSALNFPTVQAEEILIKIALVGAALALRTLYDIRAGRYAEGAKSRLYLKHSDPS